MLLDDFKARFPDFDTGLADTWVPIYENIYPCYYGGSYLVACDKEVILNLLAHLISVENSNGDSSVKNEESKTVGNVSVTFEARIDQSKNADFFGTTKYGQRFLQLTMHNIGGYFV